MKKIHYIILEIDDYEKLINHLISALNVDKNKEDNKLKDAHIRLAITLLKKEDLEFCEE
jgi:hypothetical protein